MHNSITYIKARSILSTVECYLKTKFGITQIVYGQCVSSPQVECSSVLLHSADIIVICFVPILFNVAASTISNTAYVDASAQPANDQ